MRPFGFAKIRVILISASTATAGVFLQNRTCQANPDLTTAEFLRYYFLTEDGLIKIGEASPGGAGRDRTLGLDKLMAIEVPVPSLKGQKVLGKLQTEIAELKARHAAIRQANAALLPATLERLFSRAA